jgi:hypothetical protein
MQPKLIGSFYRGTIMYEFSVFNQEKFNCRQIERIHQPLFHWRHGIDVFESLTFFNQAIGVEGVTREDTNIVLPCQLPQSQNFLIQSLQVMVASSGFLSREINFLSFKLGRFELCLGSKTYANHAPIGFFPYMAEDARPIDEIGKFQGVEPVCPYPFVFDPPFFIAAGQNFSVTLYWKFPLHLEKVRSIGVMLDGLLDRPVY